MKPFDICALYHLTVEVFKTLYECRFLTPCMAIVVLNKHTSQVFCLYSQRNFIHMRFECSGVYLIVMKTGRCEVISGTKV